MLKSVIQCHRRFLQLTMGDKVTQQLAWTKEEDEILKKHVAEHGSKNWKLAEEKMPLRIAKQCRERYHNVIRA